MSVMVVLDSGFADLVAGIAGLFVNRGGLGERISFFSGRFGLPMLPSERAICRERQREGSSVSVHKRECPSCAAEVPADHDVCDICGYEFPAHGSHKPWVKWVALAVIAVVALAFLVQLLRVISRQ